MADDDATSALIAQLLAEDYAAASAATYDEAEDYDFSSDDGGRSKKKRKSGGRPPKPQAAEAIPKTPKPKAPKPEKPPPSADSPDDRTASGRRKRKDTGQNRTAPVRSWSDDEEKLFLEGLELHGRNWSAVAAHIATRDARSVASHAQKHFIKLYVEKKPLPPKVLESGAGYTLSGKELDTSSAAFHAYAGKAGRAAGAVPGGASPSTATTPLSEDATTPSTPASASPATDSASAPSVTAPQASSPAVAAASVDALPAASAAEVVSDAPAPHAVAAVVDATASSLHASIVHDDDVDTSSAAQAAVAHTPSSVAGTPATTAVSSLSPSCDAGGTAPAGSAPTDAAAAPAAPSSAAAAATSRNAKSGAAKKAPKAPKPPKQPKSLGVEVDASGRTEYSRQRSRRTSTNPFVKSRDAALDMVTLRKYQGVPGSNNSSKTQPFAVTVSATALMLADLHAHLSTDEVIGFLGGTWDPVARKISITRVFPGKSVHGEGVTSHVQCEMDPVCEVRVRADIEASGLSVVGWYHSHPAFEPVPSQCDIDNQCNYQAFFRDHAYGLDPFVGLIVSPFDLRLPGLQSAVAWFNVQCPQTMPTPMAVDVQVEYPAITAPVSCPPPHAHAEASVSTGDAPASATAGAALSASASTNPSGDDGAVVVVEPTSAPSVLEYMNGVVCQCVGSVRPVDPNDVWRDLRGATTNIQKLQGSLLSRIPPDGDASWRELVTSVCGTVLSVLLTGGSGEALAVAHEMLGDARAMHALVEEEAAAAAADGCASDDGDGEEQDDPTEDSVDGNDGDYRTGRK